MLVLTRAFFVTLKFMWRFHWILKRKVYLVKMNHLPKHNGAGPQRRGAQCSCIGCIGLRPALFGFFELRQNCSRHFGPLHRALDPNPVGQFFESSFIGILTIIRAFRVLDSLSRVLGQKIWRKNNILARMWKVWFVQWRWPQRPEKNNKKSITKLLFN